MHIHPKKMEKQQVNGRHCKLTGVYNMYIKPFLTITDTSIDTVTLGLTDKFKTIIPKSILKGEDDFKNLDVNLELHHRLKQLNLINEDNIESNQKDSRTLSYFSLFTNRPANLLNKIRGSSVAILGCGGLGSRLALELASLNLDKITLVDPDTIEESNLPRMFWCCKKDIGTLKVNTLSRLIKKISPKTRVKTYNLRSEEFLNVPSNLIPNFLFVTADDDDGGFQRRTSKRLVKFNIPHMFAGYWESTLVAGPIIDCKSTFNLDDIQQKNYTHSRTIYKRDFIPPSIGFANSVITGVMLNEFIKYFNGNSSLTNSQWQFDVKTLCTKLVQVNS